jgi:hypothetical protein
VAKRPAQIPQRPPITPEQIALARYVGSPEHKAERWWGGLPAGRKGRDGRLHRPKKQRTTICPLTTEAERDNATLWVREALATGQFEFQEGDKVYPFRLWYTSADERRWEAYRVNDIQGEYKGWPDEEDS